MNKIAIVRLMLWTIVGFVVTLVVARILGFDVNPF